MVTPVGRDRGQIDMQNILGSDIYKCRIEYLPSNNVRSNTDIFTDLNNFRHHRTLSARVGASTMCYRYGHASASPIDSQQVT